MKRKLRGILATTLAVLMLSSTFAIIVPMATEAEDPTFDTTIPKHLYDFTTDALQATFAHTEHMTVSMGDGYTTFTATGSDPQTWIQTPSCKPNEARYAVISYRTTAAYQGEFFCTRSDKGIMGEDGTNQKWTWNPSGEWEVLVVAMDAWRYADSNIIFDVFRFDPLEGGVKVGSSIDVEYIAFFGSKTKANGFNYDEYMAKLEWEEQKQIEEDAVLHPVWPTPDYREMDTSAADNYEGTLKYTPSADGKTMTISYEINGETLSHTVPNHTNYLFGGYAGTDDLNRPLYNSNEVGIYEADKRYIGLFYFLWQGEHGDSGVFDLQKIIDEEGLTAAGSLDCGRYGSVGAMHWFAEPLYGYYYANDAWVLRKHAELLTMANIDFLFIDVTNGYSYRHNALKLMEALHELNEKGFDAPQIVFYTNTNAAAVVRDVYDNIYAKNVYPDTWFCLEGKPVIVAPYSANINDFFTIQQNQWPNDKNYKENGWPWMDFEWPQRVFTDENGAPNAINVSIAQHSGTICFSQSSLYNNFTNRGRSFWDSESDVSRSLRASYNAWKENPDLTDYGLNFQAQWDHALSTEAPIILVTGWNEWVAQRQNPVSGTQIVFIDTASMEFSRDAEMMRGGYFDNYYMQLIYNVQKAKGTAPIVVQDGRKPINVTGEFDQWNDVAVTYTDATGDTMNRNATGFGKTSYTNTTGRNDIEIAKVTSDTKNMYFYVKTVNDITLYNPDTSWMELYVNVDGRDGENGETGWYGYDFIVNYKAQNGLTTTVAQYNGTDGTTHSFAPVGEVRYRVKGNEMMIEVPLTMLGIDYYKAINVQFKWADSDVAYDEMEDFYCDGDVAPLGRLNYVYQNYIPGVNDPEPETEATVTDTQTETETEIVANTETGSVADVETDAATTWPLIETETEPTNQTDAETTTDSAATKSGCKSVLGSGAMLAMLVLSGAAWGCRKRKK